MAESNDLPPCKVFGIRFEGPANVRGDLAFRGVLVVPQRVRDAVGSMKQLEEYFASAVEDALATTWPFDGPEPEESSPLGERVDDAGAKP